MAGESVLVVDDNALNLKLVRVILEASGYDVKTAVDAETALDLLATHEPAIILMDLELPGASGLDLTRRLKADRRFRAIPIVAVSAHAMGEAQAEALAAGCAGYVTKPIDPYALPRLIQEQLASALRAEAD